MLKRKITTKIEKPLEDSNIHNSQSASAIPFYKEIYIKSHCFVDVFYCHLPSLFFLFGLGCVNTQK